MTVASDVWLDAVDPDKADIRAFLENPSFEQVVVGTYPDPNDGNNPGMMIWRTITNGPSGHGYQDESTFEIAGGNAQYSSFYTHASIEGTEDYNHIRGVQVYLRHNTTGTTSELQSLISYPDINAGIVTDLNHIEIGAADIAVGSQVWHEVGIKLLGTPAPTVDSHAFYSTWAWPSFFSGQVGMANNVWLAAKDSGGTLRNLIGIDGSNDVYLANSGISGRIYVMRPLFTTASATGNAGFRIPHGTAPSSPVDGDEWSTTSGRYCRVNGATKQYTLT